MAHLTGAIISPSQTSEVTATSKLSIPVGTRMRDTAGNEYVYCDFQTDFVIGELVAISTAFLASECGATTTGKVGIVCATVASSDLAGWVQIYGVHDAVIMTSGVAVGAVAVAATTDGLSMPLNLTSGAYGIVGMTVTTAPSTATSPTSITGVGSVSLNYPHVVGTDVGFTS